MTQEERISILNILERLGAESHCGDCMFFDECIPRAKCIYDTAHDLIENDDSMPVVHGHWRSIDADERDYAIEFECSVCQRDIELSYYDTDCDYDFCPHCGARMDDRGEQDENCENNNR